MESQSEKRLRRTAASGIMGNVVMWQQVWCRFCLNIFMLHRKQKYFNVSVNQGVIT